jgi:hypothetical protein
MRQFEKVSQFDFLPVFFRPARSFFPLRRFGCIVGYAVFLALIIRVANGFFSSSDQKELAGMKTEAPGKYALWQSRAPSE